MNNKYIKLAIIAAIFAIIVLFITSQSHAYNLEECENECLPTVEVTPTPECDQDECITPTVDPDPTATPEATINAGSDGRSDGLSSCPDCTKNHNGTNVPSGAPATGRAS